MWPLKTFEFETPGLCLEKTLRNMKL